MNVSHIGMNEIIMDTKTIILSFSLVLSCLFLGGAGKKQGETLGVIQQSKEGIEICQIIKEKTVVFLSISPEDYEQLGTAKPKNKEEFAETLRDFLYYAKELEPKLFQLGIRVIFAMSKEMNFQLPDGKVGKITFNPKDFYGMVLYAKGCPPKLATKFPPGIVDMADIISEYFHIKIK
jgi:hypothetical protein